MEMLDCILGCFWNNILEGNRQKIKIQWSKPSSLISGGGENKVDWNELYDLQHFQCFSPKKLINSIAIY